MFKTCVDCSPGGRHIDFETEAEWLEHRASAHGEIYVGDILPGAEFASLKKKPEGAPDDFHDFVSAIDARFRALESRFKKLDNLLQIQLDFDARLLALEKKTAEPLNSTQPVRPDPEDPNPKPATDPNAGGTDFKQGGQGEG